MNLYQVPKAYEAWLAAVEEAEGELSPELEEMLEEIEGTILDKADGVCALIRNATAEAEMCRVESARFATRGRQAANQADRLKALLMRAMVAYGVDRVDAQRFKVAIRKASTPSIRWKYPLEDLPGWAKRYKLELDGTKAQQEYKQSGSLPDGFTVDYSEYLAIE
jgi:hypothetical protein